MMADLHSRNMYLFMITIIKSCVLSDGTFTVAYYSVSQTHFFSKYPHTPRQTLPTNGKLVHA